MVPSYLSISIQPCFVIKILSVWMLMSRSCYRLGAMSQIGDQASGELVIMFAYRLVAVRNGLYIHMKVKEKHLSGILNDELKGNRLNREE